MGDQDKDQPQEAPLNPALKSTTETEYDTTRSSPPPIDTASASADDGKGWPIAWLVVTVLGIALAIYFLI